MIEKRGSPSLVSVAFDWSSKVTAIGLEFALPALLGFGFDHWLKTTPAATLVGAFLGFGLGMMHILRMARALSGEARLSTRSSADPTRIVPTPTTDDPIDQA